jgi:Cobalamin biosynthesis protein CobT (nicotinate-mononucleotide:5, 6-dimethylbenzimidazole phosphoribosyltransferase)
MKKFLIISVLIFSLFFFVSCGGDDDEGDTGADTGDTGSDTGDTTSDTGDTGAADTGDTAADTGDTGSETADTAADTGDTGTSDDDITDTDNTDTTDTTDTDTGDTDSGEIYTGDCTLINIGAMKLDGSIDSYAYYSGSYQPGTGTATMDEIDFEIYSATTTGVYDLTEGYNASYSSCAQCIIVYEDIVYDDGYFDGAGKYYYPESGTMTVNSFSYDSGSLNVTLENVKLIQVTREYDSENDRFKSEPVEGGSCLIIQNTTINI